MLLCLHNRTSQTTLLKTDEAGEACTVSENKTNPIPDTFLLNSYLDLGLLQLSSWNFFSEYFLKEFF